MDAWVFEIQGRENLSRFKITLLESGGKDKDDPERTRASLVLEQASSRAGYQSEIWLATSRRGHLLFRHQTATFRLSLANSRSEAMLPTFDRDVEAGIQRVSAALCRTTFPQERFDCGVYLHQVANLIAAHCPWHTWQQLERLDRLY